MIDPKPEHSPDLTSASAYMTRLARVLTCVEATDGHGKPVSFSQATDSVIGIVRNVRKNAGTAMVIGNGGSAAIASHAQNDLSKALGIRSLVFNDPSLLTALANDHGYHIVFERPILLWANRGDLLIAISSSGKSASILGAVAAARSKDCSVVTLSGFRPDNPLRALGDINYYVPAPDYGGVEMTHACILHCITDLAAQP